MFPCGFEDLASRCNGKQRGRSSLERVGDCVRIEDRNFFEQFGVPTGQRGLAGTVRSGNEGDCRMAHREDGADFF